MIDAIVSGIIGALAGGVITGITSYITLASRIRFLEESQTKEIIEKISNDERFGKILGKTEIEVGHFETPNHVLEGGTRSYTKHLPFKNRFKEIPEVIVGFSLIDATIGSKDKTTRIRLDPEAINREGFNLVYKTWHGDNQSFKTKGFYIAIGKIKE